MLYTSEQFANKQFRRAMTASRRLSEHDRAEGLDDRSRDKKPEDKGPGPERRGRMIEVQDGADGRPKQ